MKSPTNINLSYKWDLHRRVRTKTKFFGGICEKYRVVLSVDVVKF